MKDLFEILGLGEHQEDIECPDWECRFWDMGLRECERGVCIYPEKENIDLYKPDENIKEGRIKICRKKQ